MTDKEFMALVNRYTEACDDLGTGLFEQTAAETQAKHAKAAELHAQIQQQVWLWLYALNKIAERTGSDDPCRALVQIARDALKPADMLKPNV